MVTTPTASSAGGKQHLQETVALLLCLVIVEVKRPDHLTDSSINFGNILGVIMVQAERKMLSFVSGDIFAVTDIL
jgi:hypothetical protein